jgi:hypothetical protein
MKPWILCANKKGSYQIDVRDLLTTYHIKPYYELGKGNILYNPNYSLNYDFINNKKNDDIFKCRMLKDDDSK